MSRFLQDNDYRKDSFQEGIDFDDAIKLPEGGSTCDIYRTKWQRREVFVKRLKEEFRHNPLYLDALDKEYEIGISLKHPSLPDYRGFHRDYLILDFIDGETLAAMINRNDPWLKSEKNIIMMLRELVRVVDYLHRHNVTHCDIKPDNIMITANNHNVVLIDFDKCYTDSLNDTSGDPSKYGLSPKAQGKPAIDFRGIGRTLMILKENVSGFKFRKYRIFIKTCQDNECTADKLLELLDNAKTKSFNKLNLLVTLAPFVVALIFGIVLKLAQGNNDAYDNSDGIVNTLNTEQDTLETNNDNLAIVVPQSPKESKVQAPTQTPDESKDDISPSSQEEIHAEARERAALLDKRIQPYYDELNSGIDDLVALSNQPSTTGEQLLDNIRKHGDKEEECLAEAMSILAETFPGITDRETWRIMAYSKAYTGYNRRAQPILRELGMKVMALKAREAKESFSQ